ncbi:hypothetical protein KA529_01915 [Candidatus Saccharibacteria bacterium]|nr:hypothetical protein [Candidatus Saccharibacteria bacterium]
MSEKKEMSKADYERIGRGFEEIVASGYLNKKRLLVTSFLKGLATGIGSVIGATIIFVIIIWTLSLFSDIPLIGDIFENAKETIKQAPSQ